MASVVVRCTLLNLRVLSKALRFDILENAGNSDFYRVYQEDQSLVLQGKERFVETDVLRPLGGKMQCENLVLELFYRRNIMEPGCVDKVTVQSFSHRRLTPTRLCMRALSCRSSQARRARDGRPRRGNLEGGGQAY